MQRPTLQPLQRTYVPLSATDPLDCETPFDHSHHSLPPASNTRLWLPFLFVILAGIVGSFGGRYASEIHDTSSLPSPPGHLTQTWTYNRTFAEAPTDETESAWLSLFPKGRGFVQHPTLAPNILGITAFHELHCLRGIRLAYYQLFHRSRDSFNSHDLPNSHDHADPSHVQHCFDYLRQALKCAADTNIEKIEWKEGMVGMSGGVTGWGFEWKCRDYRTVVRWAEKWRSGNEVGVE